jgi:hypothetical protein
LLKPYPPRAMRLPSVAPTTDAPPKVTASKGTPASAPSSAPPVTAVPSPATVPAVAPETPDFTA